MLTGGCPRAPAKVGGAQQDGVQRRSTASFQRVWHNRSLLEQAHPAGEPRTPSNASASAHLSWPRYPPLTSAYAHGATVDLDLRISPCRLHRTCGIWRDLGTQFLAFELSARHAAAGGASVDERAALHAESTTSTWSISGRRCAPASRAMPTPPQLCACLSVRLPALHILCAAWQPECQSPAHQGSWAAPRARWQVKMGS